MCDFLRLYIGFEHEFCVRVLRVGLTVKAGGKNGVSEVELAVFGSPGFQKTHIKPPTHLQRPYHPNHSN